MADRFFPNTIPTTNELNLIMLVRYVLGPDKRGGQDFCQVLAKDWVTKRRSYKDGILVPSTYLVHLQHFLWRELAFMEVYLRAGKQEVEIPPGLSPLLQKYIMYMDGMLEGLLTTARKNQSNAQYRSSLFDSYLVVEYFVGRHEYDVVGNWRLKNADTILECEDAFKLGKS